LFLNLLILVKIIFIISLTQQCINDQIEKLSVNESIGSGDPLILDKTFDRVIFDAKQHPLIREKGSCWTVLFSIFIILKYFILAISTF
jgi:hypothetical protein